jgi:N-acetylmuramoyl-L-alanine amidase
LRTESIIPTKMVSTKNCLIIMLLHLLGIVSVQAQKSIGAINYLTAVAQPGDDALDLLSRYDLADYSCNVSQFLKINALESHRLKSGISYKLPVSVVIYNGKSIRSTLKIEDWKCAKRIEQYNKNAQKEGLRPDYFVENKRLWVPWHELNCPDVDPPKMTASIGLATEKSRTKEKSNTVLTVPSGGEKMSGGDRIFPIFGPGYQHTPLLNQSLRGKVFYLISGHGGPDVGAQGRRANHVLCEDEYAYDVTLRLLRLLLSHGATAYMIVRDPNDGIRDGLYLDCDKDEEVWGGLEIPYDQKDRLQQRTDVINVLTSKHAKAGVVDQTILEIHVDSRSQEKKQDIFFYYRPESDRSLELADHIHQTFEAKYRKAQGGRGFSGTVTPRYLFTLKETNARKAVYIELANIQNDWDQQRLVLKNNRQAIANWICHALLTQ